MTKVDASCWTLAGSFSKNAQNSGEAKCMLGQQGRLDHDLTAT